MFDRDAALRTAMELFWRHGYEGTSVSMLTEALEITPTSLYAAFGSKDELFDAAIELYDSPGTSPTDRALAYPDARQSIETILRANADAYTDPTTPAGCMVALSAVNLGSGHDHVGRKLAQRRQRDTEKIRARIEHGMVTGDLPATLDAELAASYVQTVLHGLSIQARDGCTRERAHAIVNVALAGWDVLVARAA
jgi:AcrR family transcriptional regulator